MWWNVLFVILLTCNDVVEEGGGHAENPHQEVAYGQI